MFVNIILKSKIKLFLVLLFFILLISTITSYIYLRKTDVKLNGKKIDFNMGNISGYNTNYDMTVISNKNIHTYRVEEEYDIKNNYSKLKYLDYMKNTVTIELKENSCSITNSGNMLGLNTQITNNNKNISSFATFIYMYNLINGKCECKKEEYLKEDEIKIVLSICNQDKCIFKGLVCAQDLSKLEVCIKNNTPLTYVIYDKNKKEYISILYNEFKFKD